MKKDTFWKYFFSACLVISAGIFGLNYIIDPLGCNYAFVIPGVNQYKTEAVGFARKLKPLRLNDVQPRTIILGNSRAAYGINPSSSKCFPGPVFNASIEFCQLKEMKEILLYAISVSPVEKAIFFLDYNSFGTVAVNDDFSPDSWRENGYRKMLKQYLFAYFSDNALKSVGYTLINNMLFPGFLKGEIENGYVYYEKGYDFSFYAPETRIEQVKEEASLEVQFRVGLQTVGEMAGLCRENGIDCTMVLAPFPAEHISERLKNKSYEDVLFWKDELKKYGSVFDYYHTETGLTATDFFDRVHFKPHVGEKIMDDICRIDESP